MNSFSGLGSGQGVYRREWPQTGDIPAPRFGHSTTVIGNGLLILFGGAVGDTGHYQITNECYQINLNDRVWKKIEVEGAPRPRAAHGSTRVDTMQMVIYGGATGGGTLSTEELHLLDCRKYPNRISWMTVPISGPTPGRRYGHTMNYYKPNLIVFGGNNGTTSLNDIWYMDVEQSPFLWTEVHIPPGQKRPPQRVYHSAEICRDGPANGMLVVFGGRTTDNESMKDIWGLRQHRNGTWDWVCAPIKRGALPDPRFQHTAVFIGTKMFVMGGREQDVTRTLSTVMYDTEECEWKSLTPIERFRHSSWQVGNRIFTFGGFDHQTQTQPTNDLQVLDVIDDIAIQPAKHLKEPSRLRKPFDGRGQSVSRGGRPQSPMQDIINESRPLSTPVKGVKLSQHAITQVDDRTDFSAMVRKISIDRLNQESRKIRGHQTPLHPSHALASAGPTDELADMFLQKLLQPNITQELVESRFSSNSQFCMSRELVQQLIRKSIELCKQELMVLGLRAPIKVFGDIHGQYYDLMRLFGSYRAPVDEGWFSEHGGTEHSALEGDIDSTDYLFLGDFVDRGTNSLEVMCLLMALKLNSPRQIHLIRGNHEDSAINGTYGFKDECRRRLNEDTDSLNSCWNLFNSFFEYLPLGALIEDRIFCIHGGIGSTVLTVNDVADLPRPLKVSQLPATTEEQKVTDLLWSDPTENDSQTGIVPNDVRDPENTGHIVRFGPDRVVQFLEKNKLDLIIRAHECVMDGFERFAAGRLITLFSATDYCNTHRNAGALLYIKRDLTIVPKLIYPATRDVDHIVKSTWLNLDSRPPTPPRSSRRVNEDDWTY